MPIYEYRCAKCGHEFEHLARTLSAVAEECPRCGAGDPEKQFSTFSASVARNSSPCEAGACPAASSCPPGACQAGTCPMA